MSLWFSVLLLCFASAILFVDGVIDRPRGVAPSRASFYQPGAGNVFTCLSDSVQIKFEFVNDDYCDCEDGSDEPGTSACSNMKFFCQNKGHMAEDILSSRVNDGICDCCDGSDEYLEDKIKCTNTCDELGKKRREEMELERQLREQGYAIKTKYTEEGLKERQEKEALVVDLEKSKESLDSERQELEAKKAETESPEKEAKDKHEKAWEEVKKQKEASRDRAKAAQAFAELDSNSDQSLSVDELLSQQCFDKDKNGVVTQEEIKEYLEDMEQTSEEDFIEKIWPNIKEIYKAPTTEDEAKGEDETTTSSTEGSSTTTRVPQIVPPPLDDIHEGGEPDEGFEEEGEDEDEDGDDDDFTPVDSEEDKKKEEDEDKMPDYDEETKALIEAADEARQKFDDVDKKVKDVESQIETAKKYLEKDFGHHAEFSALYNQCYEYTDREYTYKLCAFDRASQRPKNGGSETSLGRWGHWDGSSDDIYSAQKYEKGQNCWNGPDRSVKVLMQCGSENQVLSASEPSRCEYQFEFATPARCAQPDKIDNHDEL